MSDGEPLIPTPSQTIGPFFEFAMTPHQSLRTVRPLDGEAIRLAIVITDGDGRPVGDSLVELWQSAGDTQPAAFGRMPTGPDGMCEFDTVRAPHINVCLFARGLLRQLYTRVYFSGDPSLDRDPVLTLIPEARRRTLIATPDATRPGRWLFPVRLQGADETVFFER